jgi:hypothetical protein
VVTLQSGIPFDIADSGDRSLTGAGDDRPNHLGGDVVFVKANDCFNGTGGLHRDGL